MKLKTYAKVFVMMAPAMACGKHGGSSTSSSTDPYVAVPGDEATQFLAGAFDIAAPSADALSKALDLADADDDGDGSSLLEDGGNVDQTDTATINYLKSGATAKDGFDASGFVLPGDDTFTPPTQAGVENPGFGLTSFDPNSAPVIGFDPTTYDPSNDVVKVDSTTWGGKKEIMISRVNQISVKDQGQRGTCASHTGIATLEYLVLKKYNSKVSTIDLSEQRFYMMSKKDLWSTGGVTGQDGGSAWSNGYSLSLGNDGTTAPSNDPKYNIPLEADCPYNKKPGSNELQLAQAASCKRGAVKVKSMSQTFWTKTGSGPKVWHSSSVITAQQIFDYLKNQDLPVPVAANITVNWEKNNGYITIAKDKNPQGLGGHAFLIVGARLLDTSKYPNEGGMCFVVKNSWGIGWGTNGYACMTLAWFNKFREKVPFDVPFDVDVNLDYIVPKKSTAVPATITKAKKLLDDTDPGSEGMPSLVTLDSPIDNPGVNDQATADTDTPTTPDAPGTTTDGFTMGSLITQGGDKVKALYKVDGANIDIVGILSGETDVTQPLVLAYDATTGHMTYKDPKRGDKVVGEMHSGDITLCSDHYAEVCVLHMVQADKSLVVGLTKAEWDKEDPDPKADFKTLVDFAGYGIDIALADSSAADFRLRIAGTPTNALRLKIDALSGKISFKDREVGNYQKLQLCSGDYKAVCRFVVNADDKTLNIFFKAQ